MKFSVWSYKDQKYKVYDDGHGHPSTHAGSPKKTVFKSALGATPEQASWTVPTGSRFVGMFELPQGRIATEGGLPSMGDISASSPTTLFVLGGLAYFAYRSLK